jgi:protocatechuate 3,4-dioxygenase beta subunit
MGVAVGGTAPDACVESKGLARGLSANQRFTGSCDIILQLVFCLIAAVVRSARSMAGSIDYRLRHPGTQPDLLYAPYVSSKKRAPTKPLIEIPRTISEITGPSFCAADISEAGCDLTKQSSGAPIGERIIVSGRVLDEDARPVRNTLIEIWQANAAGRYLHKNDQHDSPLDPNFTGCGHTLTDKEGRYRFVSVRPGAYPWRNHTNAWRPAHIHFSVFGPAFATRLITQMYFPGDVLQTFDPIFNSIADAQARARLVAAFDWDTTIPETALGFRFDIVLRWRNETPVEQRGRK